MIDRSFHFFIPIRHLQWTKSNIKNLTNTSDPLKQQSGYFLVLFCDLPPRSPAAVAAHYPLGLHPTSHGPGPQGWQAWNIAWDLRSTCWCCIPKKSFCAYLCGLYVVVRRGTIHVRFHTLQFHQYIHREAWSGHSAEVTFITAVGTPPHWDPQLIHLGEVHRTQDCCRRVSEKMFTCVHRCWLVGCSIWIGAQGFYLQMFTDLAASKTKRKLHFISSWDCSVWI